MMEVDKVKAEAMNLNRKLTKADLLMVAIALPFWINYGDSIRPYIIPVVLVLGMLSSGGYLLLSYSRR